MTTRIEHPRPSGLAVRLYPGEIRLEEVHIRKVRHLEISARQVCPASRQQDSHKSLSDQSQFRCLTVVMFAIVDCETTGFGKHDRIVEVAAILVDEDDGSVLDEYDTLVNPQRDTGPVGVHGVTPSMVEAAPSFDEVAAALAVRLDGAVLVAHNLRFDARMLRQEYERLGAAFDEGRGHCTLRMSSESLQVACSRHGIAMEGHHRALVDARATAELLRHVLDDSIRGTPAAVDAGHLPLSPRTLRRDASVGSQQSQIARIAGRAQYPTSDGVMLSYLDMLDWVLDDLIITQTEREQMVALAEELGIGSEAQQAAHNGYVRSMVLAAQRDGVITEAEHSMIKVVASALGVDGVKVPDVTEQADSGPLVRGLRVCFTGEAVMNGKRFDRVDLEAWAAQAGLQPVSAVTKKGCDLLVAADPSSMSGKAKKARDYEKPIMSIEDFVAGCAALQIGGQDL